jgi:hypothetical protein
MDYNALHREVVSHFPSRSYRKYLAESGYLFAPDDLMAAIYRFVPLFEDRLRLLERLAELCPEVREQAECVVRRQKEILRRLQNPEPGSVCHLSVYDVPDEEETEYLCSNLQAALEVISHHFSRYTLLTEESYTRYTVTLKKVFRPGDDAPRDIFDQLAQCVLGPGKKLLRVCAFDLRDEFGRTWEEQVAHPERLSIDHLYPRIPAWYSDGAPVRLEQDGKTVYAMAMVTGLVMNNAEDLYLVVIDPAFPRHLDQETYEAHRDHINACSPDVELLTPEELPPELQDSYWGLYEYLLCP